MRYLPWKGKIYWKLGTTFHNFRSYTKFYKNLYSFKLALSRIILKGPPEARWISFIFLNSRTDPYLFKEIYFIFFWLEYKFTQILQLCSNSILFKKMEKNFRPTGRIPGGPLAHRGTRPTCTVAAWPACGPTATARHAWPMLARRVAAQRAELWKGTLRTEPRRIGKATGGSPAR
jgi:hypothetical protein